MSGQYLLKNNADSWAGLQHQSLVQRLLVVVLVAIFCHSAVGASAADGLATDNEYEQLVELSERFLVLRDQIEVIDKTNRRIVLMRMQITTKAHTNLLHEMARRAVRNNMIPPDSRLVALLAREPAAIRAMLAFHTASITLPEGGETASDLAAIDAVLKAKLKDSNGWFDSLMTNLTLSRELGLDIEEEERLLQRATRERAANVSSYLALTILDVGALKERAAILPADEDVQSLYAVQTELVSTVSNELRIVIQSLETLGLRTSVYDAQVITATGSISTDFFSANVFRGLVTSWVDSVSRWLRINGGNLVFNLVLFVIIVFISRILSRWAGRGAETALRVSNLHMSTLLRRMLVSGASTSVYVIGVLVAFSQIGISLGPLLTGLGIAGFIVGFALQETLSNFAAGMMILFYRPFDVGDVIDADGIFGEVNQMSLVNTTILTFDNQTLIVPNSKIWGNVIKNVTGQTQRRVDLTFGIGYDDDIPKAEAVLSEILKDYPSVLDHPAPLIKVHELGESSVNIIVRPWVKTEDYWNTYWDITRTVKLRFDEEGISIPFPQRDIHHYGNDVPDSPA
jgi:small conductance mechanosensitive channel